MTVAMFIVSFFLAICREWTREEQDIGVSVGGALHESQAEPETHRADDRHHRYDVIVQRNQPDNHADGKKSRRDLKLRSGAALVSGRWRTVTGW